MKRPNKFTIVHKYIIQALR